MQLDEADPLWGEMPTIVHPWADGGRDVESARCGGRFLISGTALAKAKTMTVQQKALLTTWLVDQNRVRGTDFPIVDTAVIERASSMQPMSPHQQMDRLLLYLASTGARPGTLLQWLGPHTTTADTIMHRHKALAWIEALVEAELAGVRSLLVGDGLLRSENDRISISALGFKRIAELMRGSTASDQAFIAMWFNESVSGADKAISDAITITGFRPMRIDRKEHNNKIDDEIIAEIKRSKFLVADFTCGEIEFAGQQYLLHRGGVYYEAGFAQGLGIPVIWTVRQGQEGGIHFDTRQFNHVVWNDEADLKARLVNRIRAMFVEAP